MKIEIRSTIILLSFLIVVVGCGRSKTSSELRKVTPDADETLQEKSQKEDEDIAWYPGLPIAMLSLKQIETMSQDEIQAIPEDQIPDLSIAQFKAFSRAQFLCFTREQIQGLTPAQVLSRDHIDINWFNGVQFSGLSPDVLRAFNSCLFSSIRREHFENLTLDQIRVLRQMDRNLFHNTGCFVTDFTRESLQSMGPELLDLLFKVYLYQYRPVEFMSKLRADQISGLSSELMGNVPVAHLEALSIEQIEALTAEQIQNLSYSAREYVNRRRNPRPDRTSSSQSRSHGRNGFQGPQSFGIFEDFFSSPSRPHREQLIAFMRATTHNGFLCTLPLNENIDHRTMVREHRRALLRLHPDRGADTEVSQDLNHLWDEYIAEYEQLGE
jgi:hypothetical protein